MGIAQQHMERPMNHCNRLGHRMSAATILALMSPALMSDSVAHANVPKEDDEMPSKEVAVIEPAQARLSYPVSVSKFTDTPSQPLAYPEREGIIGNQPAIIMPIQPYPFAPPAHEMTTLVPRRRRGRTPWRKAQRGW